ncbi:DUF4968 domain-containing protein [Brevundimonas albigilva]|uniref:alpha-glucosidase domain-containing protein n=1 Tax=Brevundimonas albigilva TaxID=1312364 RepID=UPI00201B5835|nr:alpha-glucosidase domain-containing protein [Brevundimonas albigilva]UQV17653.1 DUF4968 domain-containing protein [Brevundimonas albigilva]
MTLTLARRLMLAALMIAPLGVCAESGLMDSASAGAIQQAAFQRIPAGVVVTPAEGAARRVRLEVYGPETIRVTATEDADLNLPASLMVTAQPSTTTPFEVEAHGDVVVLKTAEATAEVSRLTGAVRFLDEAGNEVLKERPGSRELNPVTIEDQRGAHRYLATRQVWDSPADEAFYGLGQHQQGMMNYKGQDVLLAQHNMDVGIPFVVSSRNYGLLWETNAITRFGDPRPYGMLSDRLIVRDAGAPSAG